MTQYFKPEFVILDKTVNYSTITTILKIRSIPNGFISKLVLKKQAVR